MVQLLMPVTEASRGLDSVKAELGPGEGEDFVGIVTTSLKRGHRGGSEPQEEGCAESEDSKLQTADELAC